MAKVPNVAMNPSLEEIQCAINTTAKAILGCSKKLDAWGIGCDDQRTYYDMIARDKEVVKVVLLLTGTGSSDLSVSSRRNFYCPKENL